jgi:hypothetical protein
LTSSLVLLPPLQNDYIGLGLLLLDLLAGAHGYVKDVAITGQLGVSGKVANRALRYLQAEGLLQSGAPPSTNRQLNRHMPACSLPHAAACVCGGCRASRVKCCCG